MSMSLGDTVTGAGLVRMVKAVPGLVAAHLFDVMPRYVSTQGPGAGVFIDAGPQSEQPTVYTVVVRVLGEAESGTMKVDRQRMRLNAEKVHPGSTAGFVGVIAAATWDYIELVALDEDAIRKLIDANPDVCKVSANRMNFLLNTNTSGWRREVGKVGGTTARLLVNELSG